MKYIFLEQLLLDPPQSCVGGHSLVDTKLYICRIKFRKIIFLNVHLKFYFLVAKKGFENYLLF